MTSPSIFYCQKLGIGDIITIDIHQTGCVVDLPCFERTSFLSLHMRAISIRLPQYGEFTALKSLHLELCCIHLCTLLRLCPSLRILNIRNCSDLRHAGTVIVHSPSLEEFSLEISNHDICCIDIVAPVLKEVTLEAYIDISFTLSFLAPMVKKLRWGYDYGYVFVGFDQIWRLMSITERELDEFHVVSMSIMTTTVSILLFYASLPNFYIEVIYVIICT